MLNNVCFTIQGAPLVFLNVVQDANFTCQLLSDLPN